MGDVVRGPGVAGESGVTAEVADALTSLARSDDETLEGLLAVPAENLEGSGLDPQTYALVSLAVLVSLDAPPATYVTQVAAATACGVTPEQIVGMLVAIAPQVGIPKIVAAAPELMVALGIDLDRVVE
jgi:alkylhydroperoxidase/carboxymuconolactone decarboxylase family protein YurZ